MIVSSRSDRVVAGVRAGRCFNSGDGIQVSGLQRRREEVDDAQRRHHCDDPPQWYTAPEEEDDAPDDRAGHPSHAGAEDERAREDDGTGAEVPEPASQAELEDQTDDKDEGQGEGHRRNVRLCAEPDSPRALDSGHMLVAKRVELGLHERDEGGRRGPDDERTHRNLNPCRRVQQLTQRPGEQKEQDDCVEDDNERGRLRYGLRRRDDAGQDENERAEVPPWRLGSAWRRPPAQDQQHGSREEQRIADVKDLAGPELEQGQEHHAEVDEAPRGLDEEVLA